MSMRALGRRCRLPGLTVPVVNPPRPSAAGTYVSPPKPDRDHSAREWRRRVARSAAARARLSRDLLADPSPKGPTPKRDPVRQDRFGAR